MYAYLFPILLCLFSVTGCDTPPVPKSNVQPIPQPQKEEFSIQHDQVNPLEKPHTSDSNRVEPITTENGLSLKPMASGEKEKKTHIVPASSVPWAYQLNESAGVFPMTDEDYQDWKLKVEAVGNDLLASHNKVRQKVGAKPLTLDDNLQKHAQYWSERMAHGTGLQHGDAIIGKSTGGQNIAEGQTGSIEVMHSWINSPGHYANIINKKYTKVGFGWSQSKSGVWYWTANFSD